MIRSLIAGVLATILLSYWVHDSHGFMRDVVSPVEIDISHLKLFWSWVLFILCSGFSYTIFRITSR